MATLRDVSERAGVSISSVQRFFRGERIGEETRRAIIKAKNELRYRMDFEVEDYTQYNAVVYIGEHFSTGSFALSELQSLKDEAYSKGLHLNISIINDGNVTKYDDIDGVFAIATSIDEEQKLNKIYVENNVPVLLINRKTYSENISCVTIDNYLAAYEMVKYLISLGHVRIGIIKGKEKMVPNIERYEGYLKAMKESGLEVRDELVLDGNNSENLAYKVTKKLVSDTNIPNPTAIFALSDEMGVSTIKAITDSGLRVPEDISVVGFDDVNIASFINPSLTTVRVPARRLGILSINNMINLIENKDIKNIKMYLKHELIIRNSTRKIN